MNPVQILPPLSTTGSYYLILRSTSQYNFGTVAYENGSSMGIFYGTGTIGIQTTTFLQSTSSQLSFLGTILLPTVNLNSFQNQGLYLISTLNLPYTNGDGTLTYKLYYEIVNST